MTFTEIVDKRSKRERLNEYLGAFRRCERELEYLDVELGNSAEAGQIIESVREGLARALMHAVMDLDDDALM